MKLSVAIATFNEESNIRDCLQSVKEIADEIVIVDGTSIDKTVEIAKEFGGNTIEIYKQKDIINNLYFGQRVTFVELPQYKDVKVNVFIQYGSDLWMIQDSASQYKAHKKHIRTLFTGK